MNMVEPKHFIGLRGKLALDAPLAKHTSWRAGGGADIVYTPADRDDLAAFLRQLPIFEQVTACWRLATRAGESLRGNAIVSSIGAGLSDPLQSDRLRAAAPGLEPCPVAAMVRRRGR